jgi:hypothetical protein
MHHSKEYHSKVAKNRRVNHKSRTERYYLQRKSNNAARVAQVVKPPAYQA